MEEVQLKAKLPDKCFTPFTYNKQTNNKKYTQILAYPLTH